MASISWTWKQLWEWYEQLEESGATVFFRSFLKDIELERCSADFQFEVFRYSPIVIKENLKHLKGIKQEALIMLGEDLDKKEKKSIKRKRYTLMGFQ